LLAEGRGRAHLVLVSGRDPLDEPGFAQERARQQIEQDIQKRIQVHRANVGRLAASRMSAKTLDAAVINRPLVMLARATPGSITR